MKRDKLFGKKPGHSLALLPAIVLAAMTTAAVAGDRHHHDDDDDDDGKPPLVIKKQGSFYIGGVPKVTNYAASPTPTGTQPNQIMIGQMYVQFQIPAKKRRHAVPVIHVHGSTHTGAALESTPDGREGWLPYFVRQGIPTYVVDQPGRGRSGFDESVIHEGKALISSGDIPGGTQLIPSIGRITSNGAWTAWFGHLVSPATCTTSTDILTGELVQHGWAACDPSLPTVHPNPAGYFPAFPFDIDVPEHPANLAPLVPFADAHLGPTPFGPAANYQLKYYKQLVPNAEATLPGSICPTCAVEPLTPAQLVPGFDPTRLAPSNTWSPFDLALLVEKLHKAIVGTHSQSGIQGHHMVRVLKERGHLAKLKALITIEGSCSLKNSGLTAADFDDIAYMALVGDYTVDNPTCIDTVAQINARRAAGLGTAKAEYIKLDDPKFNGKFNGTTHMMMLGTNHLEVADVILNWVDENVGNKHKH